MLWLSAAAVADPSLTGQTGLIHMPDARVEADGAWRFGVSNTDPYLSVWSSVTFLPRLELSARYMTLDGVPGFSDPTLGDYRDKSFDAKVVLWEESPMMPAIAIGSQDYFGTRLFTARYLTVSKRLGEFDWTVGVGDRRIDGAFGGVRYTPARANRWSVVAEYDANDYRNDFRAEISGANARSGGATYGVEYRYGWLGAQISHQHGEWAGNLYVTVPLMRSEFIPKIDEPKPAAVDGARVPSAEWLADAGHAHRLARLLDRQGFRDVHIRLNGAVLELALTHDRITAIGRAVGRAARSARAAGPADITALRIVYTVSEQPLVTYEFADLVMLDRYFDSHGLKPTDAPVQITFASIEDAAALRQAVTLALDDAPTPDRDEEYVRYRPSTRWLDGAALFPFNVRIFFNDPGNPLRYDTFSAVTYHRRLGRGLYVDGGARLTLTENVSDIRQSSNSLLPHVRSDIGDYRREGDRLRLDALMLNRHTLLAERLYARASLGYYEEMYAGGGGQMLYLPAGENWAADIALDRLRQRAPGEAFGFRDYRVTTALASLHYRFPASGVTASARLGQFLAGDDGVRLELKRRFGSGIQLGVWYSITDARDITGPGTPANPYRDKGLFVSIPLASMLTRDTRERATMTMADYTRDVGQMVNSPGDLYRLVEERLIFDRAEHTLLKGFTE
jgi:hypothetical protein